MADLAPLAEAVDCMNDSHEARDDLIRAYLALDPSIRPTYAQLSEVTGLSRSRLDQIRTDKS